MTGCNMGLSDLGRPSVDRTILPWFRRRRSLLFRPIHPGHRHNTPSYFWRLQTMKRGPPKAPSLYKHFPRPSYFFSSSLSLPTTKSHQQSKPSISYSQTKSYRTLNIHPRCNSSPLSPCSPSPLRLSPLRSNLLLWSSSSALPLLLHLPHLPLRKLAKPIKFFLAIAKPMVPP